MKFTESHEYATVEGGTATVGITDFAQSALGDIVFVDLPEVGDEFEKGEVYGSVESVKAASDVYAPIGGEVIEINEALGDEPGLVNSSAEGDAWFVKLKVKDESELGDLMDADAYEAHCKAQE
jgi:glycine cleavage system H protein